MKLSFFQKKSRSLIKRCLVSFVNQSNAYLLQHMPESASHRKIPFSLYRKLWTHENKRNNDVDLVRLLFLEQLVDELLEHEVEGAFAELGVYKGNSSKLLHTLAPERKLYLLDTFEGFDAGDVKADPKARIHERHFLDTSLEQVKEWVGTSEKVVYCPGYFPETASYIPEGEKFAFVQLDVDLQAPTEAGLEFFYERLSPKGAMVIHDYSSGAWPGVKVAVDAFLKDKPESLIRIPDKSGTVVFRKVG